MIYLMKQKSPIVYYILNDKTDYVGAFSNGVPSIMNTECIESADRMVELLHKLHKKKNPNIYVESDWIDSNGDTRHDKYPIHMSVHRLDGYIENVCNIRTDYKCYLAEFEVDFISELWIKTDDSTIVRVNNFNKNILLEVDEYMKNNRLIVKGKSDGSERCD